MSLNTVYLYCPDNRLAAELSLSLAQIVGVDCLRIKNPESVVNDDIVSFHGALLITTVPINASLPIPCCLLAKESVANPQVDIALPSTTQGLHALPMEILAWYQARH